MKNIHSHPFPLSPEKAAVVIAISFISLTALAAPQPGLGAVAPATAPGAQPVVVDPPTTVNAPTTPEEDILDIRGPIHIPAALRWGAWTAGALAATGLGLAAWAFLRRPQRKLPYELALENLSELRPLMQPEQAHAYSLAASEVVRLFIEECFPVRAAHRTTREFLHDLMNLEDSPLLAHRDTLSDFLHHCDLAKFARWSLDVLRMEAMQESARA
ncbi:MAG: hypothetical protein ABI680_13565, partial [Chthoniobacteraceae bacterium]